MRARADRFRRDIPMGSPKRHASQLVYEPNDKHKLPWQRGRRGSLCPKSVSLDDAQRLLRTSVAEGSKRYATDGARAYCAQEHRTGLWHGYPVGWEEVPPGVRRELIEKHGVNRRDQLRFWSGD
jgi:hypothetical protein